MILPILLICSAAIAAGILAFGTDPGLAQFGHGVQIIMLTRRLQWPLIIVCLLLCVTLIALIMSGRLRIWWLLGLSIVLALFVRAFSGSYRPNIAMVESPAFVDADHAAAVVDPAQWVAGFEFSGHPYALPYPQLATHPLILLSDQQDRAVVIWSATANAATALPIDRTAHPREWEIVSTPADSLLLYDRRLGQFIVGVTGKTVSGQRPAGAGEPLSSETARYQDWIAIHPDSRIMNLSASPGAPGAPLEPLCHFPTDAKARRSIAVVATTQPIAIASETLSSNFKNVTAGKTSVLLIRPSGGTLMRAFDRETRDDLFLTMRAIKRLDKKHPTGTMVDVESNSLWTNEGHAIDGPLKGTQLRPIGVRNGLWWGVMKFWMPNLQWMDTN